MNFSYQFKISNLIFKTSRQFSKYLNFYQILKQYLSAKNYKLILTFGWPWPESPEPAGG